MASLDRIHPYIWQIKINTETTQEKIAKTYFVQQTVIYVQMTNGKTPLMLTFAILDSFLMFAVPPERFHKHGRPTSSQLKLFLWDKENIYIKKTVNFKKSKV